LLGIALRVALCGIALLLRLRLLAFTLGSAVATLALALALNASDPPGASGKNDLRMIADFLGFLNKVIRINRDTVTSHQPGAIIMKIPFRSGRF